MPAWQPPVAPPSPRRSSPAGAAATPGKWSPPALTATFTSVSYAPGAPARLIVRTHTKRLELQFMRAGAERGWSSVGRPWGPPQTWRLGRGDVHTLTVRPGAWQSGLYFARLTAPGGRAVTFAPFILRAAVPGVNRIAIVLPTYTLAGLQLLRRERRRQARLVVRRSEAAQRLARTARTSTRGSRRTTARCSAGSCASSCTRASRRTTSPTRTSRSSRSGDDLAKLYDLVIFSGHEEYVTQQIYDVVQRYRDLGGNLAFLSANNFFRHVVLSNGRIWRGRLWRDVGRPESALIGVQYDGNDRGGHVAPYVVTLPDAAPWLFNGISVVAGTPLSTARYGIEFDAITPYSPPGTVVLAEVTPGLRGTDDPRSDELLRDACRGEGVRRGHAQLLRLGQPDRLGALPEHLGAPRDP